MEKNIVITEDIKQLIEIIAEQVHITWMEGRIKDGWTYGPERNDTKKQTPCLVPYDELPEEEKEYDRNTALATIKCILKEGYKIIK